MRLILSEFKVITVCFIIRLLKWMLQQSVKCTNILTHSNLMQQLLWGLHLMNYIRWQNMCIFRWFWNHSLHVIPQDNIFCLHRSLLKIVLSTAYRYNISNDTYDDYNHTIIWNWIVIKTHSLHSPIKHKHLKSMIHDFRFVKIIKSAQIHIILSS